MENLTTTNVTALIDEIIETKTLRSLIFEYAFGLTELAVLNCEEKELVFRLHMPLLYASGCYPDMTPREFMISNGHWKNDENECFKGDGFVFWNVGKTQFARLDDGTIYYPRSVWIIDIFLYGGINVRGVDLYRISDMIAMDNGKWINIIIIASNAFDTLKHDDDGTGKYGQLRYESQEQLDDGSDGGGLFAQFTYTRVIDDVCVRYSVDHNS